jgi:hypothetical protein
VPHRLGSTPAPGSPCTSRADIRASRYAASSLPSIATSFAPSSAPTVHAFPTREVDIIRDAGAACHHLSPRARYGHPVNSRTRIPENALNALATSAHRNGRGTRSPRKIIASTTTAKLSAVTKNSG